MRGQLCPLLAGGLLLRCLLAFDALVGRAARALLCWLSCT